MRRIRRTPRRHEQHERLYGGNRRRESTYFDEDLSRRFRRFYEAHPWLHTRSKTLEAATEFYLHYATQYGLDEHHWPAIASAMTFYEYCARKWGVDSQGWPKLPLGR